MVVVDSSGVTNGGTIGVRITIDGETFEQTYDSWYVSEWIALGD